MSEVLTLTYGYTAKDLAAVRAYVQRVAPAIIARTYYDVDEDTFAATPSAMERHLRGILSVSRPTVYRTLARQPSAT